MKFSEIKKPSNKKFGFFLTCVFLIISIYSVFFYNYYLSSIYFLVTISLLILTFTKPNILYPLNNAWMLLGFILGKIISPIVLGIIFYLVITPIAIIFKLIKRDELNIKIKKQKTYWVKRNDSLINNNFFDKQF